MWHIVKKLREILLDFDLHMSSHAYVSLQAHINNGPSHREALVKHKENLQAKNKIVLTYHIATKACNVI